MKTIDSLRRSGIGIEPQRSIAEAARVMEHTGVGCLAVVDGEHVVGIVTDRDLVRRGLARGLPPDARVDGAMSAPVVTIDADTDVHSAYGVFRTHAVRRLAVVRDGRFVGILSIDDLLVDLAADFSDLTRPVAGEVIFAHHDATVVAER
jgi:CBS domain-containing protein